MKFFYRRMAVLVVMTCLAIPHAGGTIVGYKDLPTSPLLSQATVEAIGQQKWFFSHASVGNNILEGLQALSASNTNHYRLGMSTYGDGSIVYPPPTTTVPGIIYEAPRGNPGWYQKFTMFDYSVRTQGWHDPKVGIAMNKLCFIDQDANPTNYIATMTALERDFPATVFVYTTIPLESSPNAANVLRMDYNIFVRNFCQNSNRVLFDIADIESHDPSGNSVTFTNAGKICQMLYSGYTTDGGHLNALGEQRVALGWYAVAALLIPQLTIAQTATNTFSISWPSTASGYVLEHTNTLPSKVGGTWPVVTSPYRTNSGVISVTVTNIVPTGSRFFRLNKPGS